MSSFSSFETSGTHSDSSCSFKALNNFALRIQNLGYETGKLITKNTLHAAKLSDQRVCNICYRIHSLIHSLGKRVECNEAVLAFWDMKVHSAERSHISTTNKPL